MLPIQACYVGEIPTAVTERHARCAQARAGKCRRLRRDVEAAGAARQARKGMARRRYFLRGASVTYGVCRAARRAAISLRLRRRSPTIFFAAFIIFADIFLRRLFSSIFIRFAMPSLFLASRFSIFIAADAFATPLTMPIAPLMTPFTLSLLIFCLAFWPCHYQISPCCHAAISPYCHRDAAFEAHFDA